jgi:PadR family transcriptional regulator PadR
LVNRTQMYKGILEGCVIKILSMGSLFSQEILHALRTYGFEDMSEGTLFPLLLRLEKEGLFTTHKVRSSIGPDRKVWTDFQEQVNRIMSAEAAKDE